MENNTNNNILKSLFNRKNDEENVKESSSAKTIRKTFSTFYEDMKIKITPFESLPLVKKVEVFLKETNVSREEKKNVYQRIKFIINNNEKEFEEYHIHVFLNENINVEDDKKLELLNDFINIRCSKFLDKSNGYKFAVMRVILDKYGLKEDVDMSNLFDEIMSTNDYGKIVGLYNYVLDNNALGQINTNAIKNEMKKILEEISKSKTMQNI